jgi:hypothetical protein
MTLITDPSPATDTATDILFRSTTDRLASHCRSPVVSGSYLNWKRLTLIYTMLSRNVSDGYPNKGKTDRRATNRRWRPDTGRADHSRRLGVRRGSLRLPSVRLASEQKRRSNVRVEARAKSRNWPITVSYDWHTQPERRGLRRSAAREFFSVIPHGYPSASWQPILSKGSITPEFDRRAKRHNSDFVEVGVSTRI